jgi:hypothetical protein
MKVVEKRVDSLTIAYRCDIAESFLTHIKERGRKSMHYGRSAVDWGGRVWGELKYSRSAQRWLIVNEPHFRLMIDGLAPGGKSYPDDINAGWVHEPGWTLEVVWYAQALAIYSLPYVIAESKGCAEKLGKVWETRLRRIDICVDVAGWEMKAEDTLALVRRSRCGMRTDTDRHEGEDEKAYPGDPVLHETRKVTGISVGKNAMMARIYDKRAELGHASPDKREAEQDRWRARGWDGIEPITRVEFQLRGAALKEWGAREFEAIEWVDEQTGVTYAGLPAYVDKLWQGCLYWLRLVIPRKSKSGKRIAISKLPDDPRWALLRDVRFFMDKRPSPAVRRRMRGKCPTSQMLGAALSVLGSRHLLREACETRAPGQTTVNEATGECYTAPMCEDAAAYHGKTTADLEAVLFSFVRVAARETALDMVERWRTPQEALVALAINVNASHARFTSEGRFLTKQEQEEGAHHEHKSARVESSSSRRKCRGGAEAHGGSATD